jgi:hypothetical protein
LHQCVLIKDTDVLSHGSKRRPHWQQGACPAARGIEGRARPSPPHTCPHHNLSSPSTQIVTVHIPTGKVVELLYPPSAIEILMVDPSSDLLMSWSANSYYAAQLQQLNATTGKTSPVFTASYDLSANGGK